MNAAQDFGIADGSVFADFEADHHAALDAGFLGFGGVGEMLGDPEGERTGVFTLEGRVLFQHTVGYGGLVRAVGSGYLGHAGGSGADFRPGGVAQEHGPCEEGEERGVGEAHPAGSGFVLHHGDSLFEFGVVEAVGQGEALLSHGFPHQE